MCTVLTKNCDPPLLGWPVLAMDKVPGSFEVLSIELIGVVLARIAGDLLPRSVEDLEDGAAVGAAGAGATGLGVLRKGAPELQR